MIDINPQHIAVIKSYNETHSGMVFFKKVHWHGIDYENVYWNDAEESGIDPNQLPEGYYIDSEKKLMIYPRVIITMNTGETFTKYFDNVDDMREFRNSIYNKGNMVAIDT